jgi:hypothetical protein
MKDLYLQARFWTYSMMYGQNQLMPPFTLSHTNGSGSVASFWRRLANWCQKKTTLLLSWFSTVVLLVNGVMTHLLRMPPPLSQRYERVARRYRHIGRHRGSGRQTRAGIRRTRKQSLDLLERQRAFQELMAGPSTEPAPYVPGSRAYRKLAWSRLNHEANRVRSRYYPGDPT